MSSSESIVNSAHPPGQTVLAFSQDGQRVYTGGTDCIVRIWRTDKGGDQEPDAATDAEGAITSLCDSGSSWLSASEDCDVRSYVQHKPELQALVTSGAGAPIRCVAVDPSGKRVAVTSDELHVKIVSLDDSLNITLLSGHKRGVRTATWHPSGSLLTTSGSDGTIIVWDVSSTEPTQENVIEGIIPIVPDAECPEFTHDCSAVWHPSGTHFFIASRSHEIISLSRPAYTRSTSAIYTSPSLPQGPITAIALSRNGLYLASSSQGLVGVWSTHTRKLLWRQSALNTNVLITSLSFSPTQNLLAWTDTDGVFTRWVEPIPSSSPSPFKPSSTSSMVPVTRSAEHLFGIDDKDRDTGRDLEADIADDDWIIDDVGIMDEENENNGTTRGEEGLVKEMVSITKAQSPFQPGSTPMFGKKRYLAYNTIGVIDITDQDTHYIVNVEFHDRSARKGYHFTDHSKYELGYLGECGALFACQPESSSPAQIFYKPYTTWISESSWSYSLSSPLSHTAPLHILGIAAGGLPLSSSFRNNSNADLQGFGNVVIATSEGDLTFLSGTGRERRIMGLGADFVCMVAGPELLFVVHRAGGVTIDGSQNLSYSLISFKDFTIQQAGILPIPKGHLLKWIGISQEGAPTIYDTTGRLHLLTKYRIPYHASWARILDTNTLPRKQGKDESYWPVGVMGSTFMCLILKGRQENPGFPRPLIQELEIKLPFRRNDSKESTLEEHIERESLLLELSRDALADVLSTDDISRRELAMDKELIQLIQGACKASNIPRAIELVKLLHHLATYDMALKVAGFYHLIGLQEKIEMLKSDREEEERLVVARNKRMHWMRPDPPTHRLPIVSDGPSSKPKLLQDFGPPPVVPRPGLTRATPVIETSRFSSKAAPMNPSPLPEYQPTHLSDSPPDGKRKWYENDDLSFRAEDTSKRRAVESDLPPPKPKINPFAKKSVQDTNRNPFARKSDTNGSVHKNERFFDKVDAAESEKPKRTSFKGKEKQERSHQTTLFGLPLAEKSWNRKKSIQDAVTESQVTSISMASDATFVETPPNGKESQADTAISTQVQGEDPEHIEWPHSPEVIGGEISAMPVEVT